MKLIAYTANIIKVRIQKHLSEQGLASRREAEELILAGRVRVNGKVVRELGTKIEPGIDTIEIVGGGKKTTILYHKPRGITCSRSKSEGQTVFDIHPEWKNLHIAGRLDKESEGLLVLTDDGVLAKKITGDKHETEKEYEVTVQEKIWPGLIKKLEPGINLSDGPTLPVKTKLLNENTFRIIIREGRNHQIRRMCDFLHLTVKKLVRLSVGTFTLGTMKVGAYKKVP